MAKGLDIDNFFKKSKVKKNTASATEQEYKKLKTVVEKGNFIIDTIIALKKKGQEIGSFCSLHQDGKRITWGSWDDTFEIEKDVFKYIRVAFNKEREYEEGRWYTFYHLKDGVKRK